MSDDNKRPVIDAAECESRGRQWLGANPNGIDLYIESEDCCPEKPGPRFIQVRVDLPFLCKLQHRIDLCRFEDLMEMIKAESPAASDSAWKRGADWRILNDETGFWFHGFDGFNGKGLVTKTQRISVLRLAYGLSCAPGLNVKRHEEDGKAQPGFLEWSGGCLFYSESSMEKLIGDVVIQHPEVGARQVAYLMGARICESGVGAAESGIGTSESRESARRPRVAL